MPINLPLFLRQDIIQILHECSYTQATRIMKSLKDAYSKKKHQKVTIEEYSKYYDISIDSIKRKLNQ